MATCSGFLALKRLSMHAYTPRDDLQTGKELHCRASPAQENKTPEDLALKGSGAYFQESQRAVGNRVSTFKGCTQKSHLLQDQSRSSRLTVA